MNHKKSLWSVLSLATALVFLVAFGCKEEPAKQPAPKTEQPSDPDKKPPEQKPAEQKPAEQKPAEQKPVEQKPVEQKPVEQKPTEENKPTAAMELKMLETTIPPGTVEPTAVTKYLKGLADFEKAHPDTPEAARVRLLQTKVRMQSVTMDYAGKAPELTKAIMVFDGKFDGKSELKPEVKVAYYRHLAAEAQNAAGKASGEDVTVLQDYAALAGFMADDLEETQGLKAGNVMKVPDAWLVANGKKAQPKEEPPAVEPETKPEEKAEAKTEAKAEEKPGAKTEAKAVEKPEAKTEDKAEAKTEDKPEAKVEDKAPGKLTKASNKLPEGTKEAVERPAPAAMEAKPSAPTAEPFKDPVTLSKGGVDPATLMALATKASPVAADARIVLLGKVRGALLAGVAPTEIERWFQIADGFGKYMCVACGQLGTVAMEYRKAVIFSPANEGLVCADAAKAIMAGTPPYEAVGKSCFKDFGISADDYEYLSGINAIALRAYTLVMDVTSLDAPAGDSVTVEVVKAMAKEVRGLLKNTLALYPPIRPIPKDKWEEMKDKLVVQSDLLPVTPPFVYHPLDVVVTDETQVAGALRPVAGTESRPFTWQDKGAGYGLPGKKLGDINSVKAEVEEKEKPLKEKKAPYSEFFGAFFEFPEIRGVKFEKPDYSVPSLVAAANALSTAATALETGAYGELQGKAIVNSERPNWPDYKNTVGKAALIAVDRQTPALFFKRVLDSWYHADFKDFRLIKGTGCAATVPTVYYTEKFVDPSQLDMTYKRPILVYVTADNTVNFYPPTNSSSRSKMTPNRSPNKRDSNWPGKYRSVYDPRIVDEAWNLFMAYVTPDDKDFDKKVAEIARAMQRKWDAGNVFYVMAHENASSGMVVKVADILANLDGKELPDLGKAFPGYSCVAGQGEAGCLTNVVVLFPEVEIPYLPGKQKVQEVQQNVYCDEKDIARRIASKAGAIKFCYDGELKKNPSLKGKVVYKFTIGSEGRVTAISVESDAMGNSTVVDCAMKVIRGVQFARPIGGECKIRYPYVFKP